MAARTTETVSAAGPARADATGSLAATPLSDVLVSLLDRRLTGSVVLQDPAGRKSALTVAEGAVVKARTPEPVIRLGDLLLEVGAIDSPTLERGLRLAKQSGIALGQALLRAEAVASEVLEAVLAEQLARRVLWVAGMPPETRYGFYGGTDHLENWGAGAVENEPLSLIWRAAREHASPERVEAIVTRIATRRARLHPDAQLERFNLNGAEARSAERIRRGSETIGGVLAAAGPDAAVIGRLIYVLVLTRHLDLGDGRVPVGCSPVVSRDRFVRGPTGPSSAAVGEPTAASGRVGAPLGSDGSMRAPGAPPPIPTRARSVDGGPASAAVTVPPVGAPLRPLPPPPRPPAPTGPDGRPRAPAAPTRPEASLSPPEARVPPSRVQPPLSVSISVPASRHGDSARAAAGAASLHPGVARPDPLEWRLNAKLAQCERRDLYGLLEVEHSAPTALIQAAYVKLAKVWHPDRLPPAMAHRREDVTRLFARLSEARRALCDPDERARYDREQSTGESEEANVVRVVDAANEFRKAELLARRNDFSAAIPHAEAAYKNDDEQPEYAALFAYVIVQSGVTLEPKRLSELVELVEDAVTRDAESVRIRLYRAFVLKRAGRIEDAQRDFRFVARNERHNVDAMREIRLYNLRRDKEKQGTFLGGLFGRPSTSPKSRR